MNPVSSRVLCGDCLEMLPTLPAGSVNCCVTSPPYFGLRDYGTAAWEGGEPGCDHVKDRAANKKFGNPEFNVNRPSREATKTAGYQFDSTCTKCGAVRVDSQLGLESRHDCLGWATGEPCGSCYVCRMVAVFREVRRVLADDGTLFLNLGDSFFGSGKGGNAGGTLQGTPPQGTGNTYPKTCCGERVLGRDIGDTSTPDSLSGDRASQSPYDGRTENGSRHTSRTCAHPSLLPVHESLHRIRACTAELRDHLPSEDCSDPLLKGQSSSAILDRAQTVVRECVPLLVSLQSTIPESLPPPLDVRTLADGLSACLSSLRSLDACVRRYAHTFREPSGMLDCTEDTASLCEELQHHIQCTSACCSLVLAWFNPPNIQPYCTTPRLKPKDLIGVPWRVALALQADGWWLRSDIVWSKTAPMPESVTDRPTRAHEFVFLLAKSERYFYDADAIAETAKEPAPRYSWQERKGRGEPTRRGATPHKFEGFISGGVGGDGITRNKRDVWTIGPSPFPEAHFAVMPADLVKPCVRAGCPVGGTVLDPFAGSGTVGHVAISEGRSFVGIELNPEYAAMARRRISKASPALPGLWDAAPVDSGRRETA